MFVIMDAIFLPSLIRSREKADNLAPSNDPFPANRNLFLGISGNSPIVMAFSISILLPEITDDNHLVKVAEFLIDAL